MPYDRFLIAPFDKNSGRQSDFKPFIIPEDAFTSLNNAYVFRGRVRKRFGSRWIGGSPLSTRLRISLGTTMSGTVTGMVPGIIFGIGQMFSIGTQIFTVYQDGMPGAMLNSTGVGTGVYNTSTGAYAFAGVTGSTEIYFYPSTPVMGLISFEQGTLNDEATIAFDTQFAYQYITNTGWDRIAGETNAGDAIWTGSDSQFFWGASYVGADAFDYVLFVTNFNENEPNFMRYLFNNTWTTFDPVVSVYQAGPPVVEGIALYSAKILVPFKNRLLAFNTWENETSDGSTFQLNNYPFRVRWSAIGSPLAANAWRQDIPGQGSGLDAPVNEAIVTVEFIKDRLIVYFEESTWELVYTGNQIYPFVFQQINTELGAESTFSIVPFDKVAIGIGTKGIHACNGSNVERVDNAIPDTIFNIQTLASGQARVYGIRDYFLEQVYWTYPDASRSDDFPYPNKILVYNYKTSTWATFDDSITAFGNFQAPAPTDDVLWSSNVITWSDPVPWGSGSLAPLFRNIIAGNQEGWTFICDSNVTTNAGSLQITDITLAYAPNTLLITAINHNITDGDYVLLENIQSTVPSAPQEGFFVINGFIGQCTVDITNPNTFLWTPESTFESTLGGTYLGGGDIVRISNINFRTKAFNFYLKQGRNSYIPKVDFLVDSTFGGQIQVDFYVSTNIQSMFQASEDTGTIMGTSNLDTFPYPTIPFEAGASQLWHPVYFQGDGEFIQFSFNMNALQLYNPKVQMADFQLHAMCIYATPTSYHFR